VVLADDHALVRAGMRSLLNTMAQVEVVGEAASGEEALDLARRERPDVVLMDIAMKGMTGLDAAARIREQQSGVRVVILSMHSGEEYVLKALKAGAVGYLLKDVPGDELFRALRAVHRGERQLAPVVTERLMARWKRPPKASLTERELDVLRCVARGEGNKQIAASLGIAEPTVKAHLVHIFEKLGADNRTAAARIAREQRLIDE
jgi:DNA-binding NarL/FixJ family response regulator